MKYLWNCSSVCLILEFWHSHHYWEISQSESQTQGKERFEGARQLDITVLIPFHILWRFSTIWNFMTFLIRYLFLTKKGKSEISHSYLLLFSHLNNTLNYIQSLQEPNTCFYSNMTYLNMKHLVIKQSFN